jgi:hypothetical protein
VIAALLLAACSQPSGNVLVAEGGGFRVPVPDGWDARATDPGEWADHRTVAILATQSLDPQCALAGSAGDCTTPLASLAEGELLVWWQSATCAGAGCDPPDGERLPVGGRQASRVGGSHLCDSLGATHEEAYFVTVTPQRLDAIVVCDRRADEATLAQLADLLEHVTWRTP